MGLVCPGKVPTVVDVIEDNGFLWTVTERPAGVPLSEILGNGPLNYVRTARIGLGLLDVISAAHRHGQTHGDLSPGQICVDQQGRVTVSGFGLMGDTSSPRVTAPSYASPEQARGESTGPAADLWALGAMMYAMVEGRPAIRERGGLVATLRAVERLPIRQPLSAGPLSPAIQGLLRRDLLERVPEPVVRESLTRILKQDLEDSTPTATLPVFRDTGAAPGGRGGPGADALSADRFWWAGRWSSPSSASRCSPRRAGCPTGTPRRPDSAPSPTAPATSPAGFRQPVRDAHRYGHRPRAAIADPDPDVSLPHRRRDTVVHLLHLQLARGLLHRPAQGLETPADRQDRRPLLPRHLRRERGSAHAGRHLQHPARTRPRQGLGAIWSRHCGATPSTTSAWVRSAPWTIAATRVPTWSGSPCPTGSVSARSAGVSSSATARATHCAGRPRPTNGTTPPTRRRWTSFSSPSGSVGVTR